MENSNKEINSGEDSYEKSGANRGAKEEHVKEHDKKNSSTEGDGGCTEAFKVVTPRYQYRHRRDPSSSQSFCAHASPSYDSYFNDPNYNPDHLHYEAATQYKDSYEQKYHQGGGARSMMPVHSGRGQDRVMDHQFPLQQEVRYDNRAVVTPSRRSLRPPPDSASPAHSPESYYQLPYTQALSSTPRDVRDPEQSSISTKKLDRSMYVHPRPIWAYQQQSYDSPEDYFRYQQSQYHDFSDRPRQLNKGSMMASVSTTYDQESSGKPHFTYTFDRHGALKSSSDVVDESRYSPYHRQQERHHAAAASSRYQSDPFYSPRDHHHPIQEHRSFSSPETARCGGEGYYPHTAPLPYQSDPYYSPHDHHHPSGEHRSFSSPEMARGGGEGYYSRDPYYGEYPKGVYYTGDKSSVLSSSSTDGTDHKAAFDMMIEDPSRIPPMPKTASEVDFDVMKPPLSPVTLPSKDNQHSSPDALNIYDVLLGRGGGTNSQIGNRHFRSLVHEFQPLYLSMKRKDKPLMARSLVLIVRNRGGRFLQKDEVSSKYYEVGDEKAEAKASQALREGLKIRTIAKKRKEMSEQRKEVEKERMKKMKHDPTLGVEGPEVVKKGDPQRDDEERQSPSRSIYRGHYQQVGGIYDSYYRAGPEEIYQYDRYENPSSTQPQEGVETYEPLNGEEERRIRGGGEGGAERTFAQQPMPPITLCMGDYDHSSSSHSSPMHTYHQFYIYCPQIFRAIPQQAAGLSTADSSLPVEEQTLQRARAFSEDENEQLDENAKNEKVHVVPM